MKLRRTAWLLTVLLSLAGCFGTPVASFAIPGSSYSVVWPDKSAAQPTVPRQEITESRRVPPQLPNDSLQVMAKDDAPAPATLLDPSLFQRPPPPISTRP
ncbi:MAG: hypothetical protein ACRD4E_15240 [Bryobacteraceae bacterium]